MRVASFLRLISERFGSWLLDWLMTHRAAHRSIARSGTRFQIVFRLFRRFFEFVVFQFWNQILKNKFIFGKLPKNDEFGKKPKLFLKKKIVTCERTTFSFFKITYLFIFWAFLSNWLTLAGSVTNKLSTLVSQIYLGKLAFALVLATVYQKTSITGH